MNQERRLLLWALASSSMHLSCLFLKKQNHTNPAISKSRTAPAAAIPAITPVLKTPVDPELEAGVGFVELECGGGGGDVETEPDGVGAGAVSEFPP
jgi:hypothetical protein